jgi:hypothetical protein
MNSAMTDTDSPRLGIGDAPVELICGGDRVISQFKGSGFDVVHCSVALANRHNHLPMITFFDLLAHL